MDKSFLLSLLLSVLIVCELLHQGYCNLLNDVNTATSNFSQGLVRDFEASAFHKMSRKENTSEDHSEVTRKENVVIRFDPVCGPISMQPFVQENHLQNRMFLPIMNMLYHMQGSQLGDRTGASQDTKLLRQLVRSNWSERGYESVYDVIRDNFGKMARSGLLSEVQELNISSPESLAAFHNERTIRGYLFTSIPDYYFKRVQGPSGNPLPCPLLGGYPLSWKITADGESPFPIDITAVPATKQKDGSFRIISPPLNLTTVLTANRLLLKQNNWTTDNLKVSFNATRPKKGKNTIAHNRTMLVVKVLSDVLNCTANYVTKCGIYSLTPRDSLCTKWGDLCGVRNVIKLPSNIKNGTHMLYIPSKTFGGNITMQDGAYLIGRAIEDLHNSQRTVSLLSEGKLSEVIDSMAQTESIYLPKVEGDQDLLTLVVIFLVFLSEWIFSTSFLAEKLWTRLVKCRSRVNFLNEKQERQHSYGDQMKKFKRSCTLLIPALAGFIPLPLGLHQAAQRKDAVVGVLASGWAANSYQAFHDPQLETFSLDKGRSLSLTVEYRELRMFDNLFHGYVIATFIAAILLAFSFCALSSQVKALLKERPKKKLSENDSREKDKELFMSDIES